MVPLPLTVHPSPIPLDLFFFVRVSSVVSWGNPCEVYVWTVCVSVHYRLVHLSSRSGFFANLKNGLFTTRVIPVLCHPSNCMSRLRALSLYVLSMSRPQWPTYSSQTLCHVLLLTPIQSQSTCPFSSTISLVPHQFWSNTSFFWCRHNFRLTLISFCQMRIINKFVQKFEFSFR